MDPYDFDLPHVTLFEHHEPPLPDLRSIQAEAPAAPPEARYAFPAEPNITPSLPAMWQLGPDVQEVGPLTRGLSLTTPEATPLPDLPDLALLVSAPPPPSPTLDRPQEQLPLPARLSLTPRFGPSEAPASALPSLAPEPDLRAVQERPEPLLPSLPEPVQEHLQNPLSRAHEIEMDGMAEAVGLLGEIAAGVRKLTSQPPGQRPHMPPTGPLTLPPSISLGPQTDGFAAASPAVNVSRLSGLRGAGGWGYASYAGTDPRANFLEPQPERMR